MKDSDRRADPYRFGTVRRSVRSSTAHPTAAQVALCRDGGLSTREASLVAAHVRSCPRCRRVAAKLSEVRRILAHQPYRNMPRSVAVRIDRALIAQAAPSNGHQPPRPRRASLYS